MKRLLIAVALLCAYPAMAQNVAPITNPQVSFVDASGNPCAGCKLYSYIAGTTTPLATFTDSSGISQNTNPTILDASGGAQIWMNTGNAYKFILKDAGGTTLWTTDNVPGFIFGNFVSKVTLTPQSILSSLTMPDLITKATPAVDIRAYGSLASAYAAAAAVSGGATIFVPAAYSENIGTGVTFAANNVSMQCQSGASFTRTAAITILTVTGVNNTISGCTFSGAGISGNPTVVLSGTNTTFTSNYVKTTLGTGVRQVTPQGIEVLDASTAHVAYNTLTSADWVVRGNSSNVIIEKNSIDDTTSNYYDAAGYLADGANMKNLTIRDNLFRVGNIGFCLEGGERSGGTLDNVLVEHNTCELTANTVTYGGFSLFATTENITVKDNYVYASLVTTAAGIGAYEFSGTGGQYTGNHALTGGMTGMQLNALNKAIVSHNDIAGATAGIELIVPSDSTSPANNNVISMNTITLPASGSTRGIILSDNSNTYAMNNNSVIANTINGNANASSQCVTFEKLQAAAVSGNMALGNTYKGCGYGFYASSDTNSVFGTNTYLSSVSGNINLSFQGTGASWWDSGAPMFSLDASKFTYDATNHVFRTKSAQSIFADGASSATAAQVANIGTLDAVAANDVQAGMGVVRSINTDAGTIEGCYVLGGRTNSGNVQPTAAICAIKQDILSSSFAGGDLCFYTVPSGSQVLTQRGCFSSVGIFSVGGGANVVYRCVTNGATLPAGSLTVNAGACGTSADTGIRVP